MKYLLAVVFTVILLSGCSSSKQGQPSLLSPTPEIPMETDGSPAAIPSAKLYRMSGDYAAYVPVQVSGGQLVSYPAPEDIRAAAHPLEMAPGLWLDRRGVGTDTRFINYTYAEYSRLSQAPSPREIMQAIIPDARVTAVYALPFTVMQALTDTLAIKEYVTNHIHNYDVPSLPPL